MTLLNAFSHNPRIDESLVNVHRNERVCDLKSALDAYWKASSNRAADAAYHEILLFGGKDGYPPTTSRWRLALARWLRLLALKVERRFG